MADVGVRFLGHATVVLELDGTRVVTDPFLRDRLGPLRRHGLQPDPADIGDVDAVLISHAHPDHFDVPSLLALHGEPHVVVPRGLGGRVRRLGLRASEVSVGDRVTLPSGVAVTAVPARHWRWPAAPAAPTLGYLLERSDGLGIWFAGDTARFPGLRRLAGQVGVALLPVGSWGPHLTYGHLSPRTAAEVARDVQPQVVVPIHWGTLYPRGLHRIAGGRLTEPGGRFAAWMARLAPEIDVRVLSPGASTRIAL